MSVSRAWTRALLAALVAVATAVGVGGVVALAGGSPLGASQPRPSAIRGEAAPPVGGDPVTRIAVTGDTGTGEAPELATARRIAEEGRDRPYDGLLLLGDMVYPEGKAGLVDDVVTGPFHAVLGSGAELVPVLGNHDEKSGQDEQILRRLGHTSPWYTETLGDVRIVVLDSNQVGNADQTRWLENTLAAPTPQGTWTVVAMHHPAYSAGQHGSTDDVQQTWVPLFERYQVPLVLAGHDHDYQRSYPQSGVVYVVSGAGAKLRPTGSEDFTAVSTSTLHYVDLLAYPDRLVGRAIDQQGRLLDEWTITR